VTTSGWLGLAASPSFAAMATLSAVHGSDRMLCAAMPGASLLDGMTVMYGLMCVFHASPWISLVSAWHGRMRVR
jgi:hypothetical protein